MASPEFLCEDVKALSQDDPAAIDETFRVSCALNTAFVLKMKVDQLNALCQKLQTGIDDAEFADNVNFGSHLCKVFATGAGAGLKVPAGVGVAATYIGYSATWLQSMASLPPWVSAALLVSAAGAGIFGTWYTNQQTRTLDQDAKDVKDQLQSIVTKIRKHSDALQEIGDQISPPSTSVLDFLSQEISNWSPDGQKFQNALESWEGVPNIASAFTETMDKMVHGTEAVHTTVDVAADASGGEALLPDIHLDGCHGLKSFVDGVQPYFHTASTIFVSVMAVVGMVQSIQELLEAREPSSHQIVQAAKTLQRGLQDLRNTMQPMSAALDAICNPVMRGMPAAHCAARLLAVVLASHRMKMADLQWDIGFDEQYSRRFSLKPACYGLRGDKPYHKPVGWWRFSVKIEHFADIKDWPIAYHGTKEKNVLPILGQGLKNEHAKRQSGSKTRQTLYVSPSIEYAAHPVYAFLYRLDDDHWGQVVLQCRVRPHSFRVQGSTLGKSYWPPHLRIDANFPNNSEMEWLIEDSSAIVVTGVMIRELGLNADPNCYGEAANAVRDAGHESGPGFHWNELRAADYEKRGYFCSN